MAKIGVIVSTLAGPGQSQCFAKVKGREVFMRSLELFIARDDFCAPVTVQVYVLAAEDAVVSLVLNVC